MTVSLPAIINVDEGDGTVQICATLVDMGDIERDFIISLSTINGTGSYISTLLQIRTPLAYVLALIVLLSDDLNNGLHHLYRSR